ncbi:hypothetical protein AK88_03358 [Plasmodium fragile]|uniref:Uncharacterized protein n=1 Tax=Plasmodium fragile TaxID=5857 RepID=A0A0D9QIU8_PLAFR|nr:uncharacterized protein AK88_03358 [Plasmodium fragile]KJP86959.1 hypothetical protein AK88_03358 [Plasmodium fragile]
MLKLRNDYILLDFYLKYFFYIYMFQFYNLSISQCCTTCYINIENNINYANYINYNLVKFTFFVKDKRTKRKAEKYCKENMKTKYFMNKYKSFTILRFLLSQRKLVFYHNKVNMHGRICYFKIIIKDF